LKFVLLALVAEMSYSGMDVASSTDAGLAWEALTRSNEDGSERERLKKALLDYCRQDTLALIRLVDRLLLPPSNSLRVFQPAPTR
jgi:hypothetical protein